ncbi:MAG: JAB domain-containing protein [Clostridiales bacterium]|nr:JAB domain-containing protein [Clostridiales bacterium]
MPAKKTEKKGKTDGQYSIADYQMKQVEVRLKLMDGPAYYSKTPLAKPADAARVMCDVMKDLDREWVCVVNMDNHLKPVNFNVVSIGSINSSLAPIQNIIKSGVLSNTNNLMLMHNHPSGDIEPSNEDYKLTKRLLEACKIMDMCVVDHLIIGSGTGDVYSFREHYTDLFTSKDLDLDYLHSMTDVGEKSAEYKTPGRFDPKQAMEARKKEMKDITSKLEQGVAEVFQSDRYKEFLNTMAKFPKYSLNNNLLIMMQKPDASLCQSYTGWKQMGRFVRHGEKGIRILAPVPYRLEKDKEKMTPDGKAVLDKDGEPVREHIEINMTAFKAVSTFDVSQTEGDPLPQLGESELTGSVEGFSKLFEAIKEAGPVPVAFEDIKSGAKGYFHTGENRIAIQNGMSEVHNIKTLIHETAHAKLHNMNLQKARDDGGQSRNSKEIEAESVAFTVCQHYGIDTSDYSFAYIAGWSEGKEMSELKESLATIRQSSSELIAAIDEKRKGMTMEETEEKPTEKKESVTAKLKAAQNSEKRMPTKPRNKQKEDGLITI